MTRIIKSLLFIFIVSSLFIGCASKRKKGKETSKLGKFYHNTTALYNGYFNANELMKKSYLELQSAHQDNYNEILPLYDYIAVADAKIISSDLDKAIEKVTTVAALHEPSKWVDDCYVLMGEAQYLKQDYETAEETFAYFKNEFNPNNPFGRNYKKKKQSKKAIKKAQEKKRKEEKKAKENEKKANKKLKEEERKTKEKAKEDADKLRKEEREKKKKEREAEKKRKKKNRKKGKRGSKKREVEPSKKEEKITPKEVTPKKTNPLPEKKKEDKEEEYTQSSEKKKEKKIDKTAYSMGMIWYAKTLVQREKYANASYLVNRMRDEGGVKKDVLREIPVILADINIREKNYSHAIDHLNSAVELANNKKLKARYVFIQGQLELLNKNYANASQLFSKAKKWAKSFEMEFQSEMNFEKTMMLSGEKSNDAVMAKLDKMIKEDKYFEYNDQLYYTKGEILLANNQFDEALSSFSKSIASNSNNIPLKQETYYKLAKLFYEREDYVDSRNYYDSTLQVIDKEDPRFKEVSNYSINLADIANNIELIKYNDSLISMVAWDDNKIEKLAEKLVEENRKAEESGSSTKSSSGKKSTALLNGIGGGFKTSKFFAYDPIAKLRGKKEFEAKWGEIELEDDWRRQEKSGVFTDDKEENEEDKIAEDGFEEDPIEKMIASIKSTIPYSEKAKSEINTKLETAFHELGKGFRDKIQNYKKSAKTLEELLRRFPSTSKKLDAYYYLYLTYLDLNNNTKANYYKNKVLTDFPDTEYAKAISDPEYASKNLSKEQKLEKYYEETYGLFTAQKYKLAYNQAKNADEIFGKANALRPKFGLLMAMATGNFDGKAAYVKALRDVVTRFPNTPEKARADEILRFLQGDSDAFTGIDIEEVDNIYSIENDKLHYIAVVLYDTDANRLVTSKITISNYNKEYHKLKKLQLGESALNREKKSEVILIRRFENREKAMAYYNEVMKSKSTFIPEELGGYELYPITQRNYRKMIIEQSDARYRVFFNKYYLKK
ncbi:MAG: hypothetical protein V3V14_03015 [Saprospiraceae bacterium]